MKKLSCTLTILMTMFFLVSFNYNTENLPVPLPELDFLKKLKAVSLPYRDSTNFDNHTDKPQMRETEIEQLRLKSKIPDGFGFTLNHKLIISPQFHAVVVSYQPDNEALCTALITYDKDYNIIDMLEIAFDEIAESMFRKESTVYTDHITVENMYCVDICCMEGGAPTIETTDYKIESDGTFTSLPAIAPDAIVTMTTTSEMVDLRVGWTGCGSIIANGVILTDEPETANMIPAAADGSVALTTKGDAQLIGLVCTHNSLTALDVSKCQELTGLGCNDNSLMVLDITKCPKLKYLNANNQTPKLPIVKPDDDTKLSIKNPVKFAGAEVSIENINYRGTYTAGIITWLLSGESGEAAFHFTAKLPDGFEGESFSGIFIQPWTKK